MWAQNIFFHPLFFRSMPTAAKNYVFALQHYVTGKQRMGGNMQFTYIWTTAPGPGIYKKKSMCGVIIPVNIKHFLQ